MANTLRIGLKIEQKCTVKENKIVLTGESVGYNVYANCDEVECWIGSCTDIESLEKLVGEKELINSIQKSASEYESLALMAVLECNDNKYEFFGEIKIAE